MITTRQPATTGAFPSSGLSPFPQQFSRRKSKPEESPRRRALLRIFWVAVAIATFLAGFVFPFFFPLKVPVFSPVYTAGGNNRLGAMAVAVVSVLTALACWKFRIFARPVLTDLERRRSSIPVKWLWLSIASLCLMTLVLTVLVIHSGVSYVDSGYFLAQLRAGLVLHGKLYRDFEFAYGPLLYYWPAMFLEVLGFFHLSATASYMASLAVLQAIGTAMLFYTVSALPVSRTVKIAAFLSLVLLTFDPQAGLNYTAFRFVITSASMVLLARQRGLASAALVAALGVFANFCVSPELGLAFLAAVGGYAVYQAFASGGRWLALLLAEAFGTGLFALISGPDSLRTLREFAHGGYNLLLEPAPHIWFLMFCAAGLAPTVVAEAVRRAQGTPASRREEESSAGLFIGLYLIGLAMLAPALGRCDPLHVSYNGWPIFLLSFVALDRMRRPVQLAGIGMAFFFGIYCLIQEYALCREILANVILHRPQPYENADFPRLKKVLRGNQVTLPWGSPMQVINQLTAAGEYKPLYLYIPAMDEAAERRTLQEMRSVNYLMIPREVELVTEHTINNVGLKYHLRFNYKYKARHQPFLQGALLAGDLRANWHAVGDFGAFTLYRKDR